jgi:hypothetical protein
MFRVSHERDDRVRRDRDRGKLRIDEVFDAAPRFAGKP